MLNVQKEKEISYHPSYGYATKEQISILKNSGLGPTRTASLNEVALQTRRKSKQAVGV